MNKKTLVFFLILVLIFTTVLTGCGKKDKESKEPETKTETGEEPPAKDDGNASNQIILGSTTAADGNWNAWGFWANNATDRDVSDLTNYMGAVQNDPAGELKINESVIESYEAKKNDDGSKTYTWKIKEGLKYSDGTPITAKDFAAAKLLWGSPQMAMFEAKTANGPYKLKGFEEFNSGVKKEFEGVRLLDDSTIAITIDAEYLPDFYELLVANIGPDNLKFWTGEGVDIKDDGNGCYFTGDFADLVTYGEREKDAEGNPVEPERTPEQQELFNKYSEIVKGAREAIAPSTGPYMLEKFDKATKEVILKLNPNFPGDYQGQKASIETIILREVKAETSLDQLKTGEVDVLTSMMSGDEINAGLDLVEKGGFDYVTYPRAGYGMLHFHSDFGPTRFKEVRQAIAHLLNREDFVKKFTGGFGTVVDGPYGEGQWMYQQSKKELQSTLNHYSYSLADAVALLEKVGYTLNENGEEFKTGTDKMRYRKNEETGELEPLKLRWASTKDNPVSEILVVTLQKNPDVEAAGIVIEQDVMDFGELLSYYRRSGDDPKYKEPTYSMFNLASNFPVGYLPTKDYTLDPDEVALGMNVFFLFDEELDKSARALKDHEPEDKDGYRQDWAKFITKWNELVPEIPLYSNTIHDFFNAKVKNYNNTAQSDTAMTLMYATVEE